MSFLPSTTRSGSRSRTRSEFLVPQLRRLIEDMRFEVIPTPSCADRCASLEAGTTVSVTCSPVKGIDATLATAAALAGRGLRPIPHLSARMVASAAQVHAIAEWGATTGVRKVFVIGGDTAKPAGPYPDALSLIRALLEVGAPLDAIGSAAYPDAHPLIPTPALDLALFDRQAVLAEAGVAGWVSTQICFDAVRIERWLGDLRGRGFAVPVHLGIPGAVQRAELLSLGVRLGIGASLRYLRKNRAVVRRVAGPGGFEPMELLDPLAPHVAALGIEALHVFTFNQVAATHAWRLAVLDDAPESGHARP